MIVLPDKERLAEIIDDTQRMFLEREPGADWTKFSQPIMIPGGFMGQITLKRDLQFPDEFLNVHLTFGFNVKAKAKFPQNQPSVNGAQIDSSARASSFSL